MDISNISTLIGTVGFPIAMCIIMFYYMNKERETHENEVNKLNESLNNNTQILTELKVLINSLVNNK